VGNLIRYHCSGYRNIAFENPPVLGRQAGTVEQIFFYQLPGGDESVASKGQTLGSIGSRLGIEHEHRVWEIPFPLRPFEVWFVVLQIRIDAKGKN
jgi:hypothetical protein